MLRDVLIQLAATLLAATAAGLIAGGDAFFSALLGGLCCVVPNGLFALSLFVGARKPESLNPMTFFFRGVYKNCVDDCLACCSRLVVSRLELAGATRCFHRRFEKLSHLII